MKIILRTFRLFILLSLSLAMIGPSVQQAQARNIFDIIFNRKKEKQPTKTQPQKPATSKKKSKQATQAKVQPKKENAKRILVVGDFVAGALADGLNELYADNPDVVIRTKIDSSSGFVRDDHFNWIKQIGPLITQEKADVIIIMLGANDNQTLRQGDGFEPRTETFNRVYQERLSQFSAALKQSGKPFLWMGQPAFKQDNLTQQIVVLNGFYKTQTEAAGGRFIEVWDGFVGDDGKFALSGYDISGKTVRLRSNDGINFTPAGRKKLAFYAEKPLQAILNLASPSAPDNGQANDTLLNAPNTVFPRNVERVAPMSLYEMAKGNNSLVGDVEAPQKSDDDDWQPKNGQHAGRVDNYAIAQ